ncbi:MAG: Trp family transcriptional regulator [bacterium]|nr:Trp family transcriptional regulator [bacterium]
MKVRAKKLTDVQRIETLDALYTAAGAVRGREAMKLFLRDLLTESERIMLGRRIVIARRILAGDHHDDIATDMHVGYDTIYRVRRWLEDQLPGYEQAIQGMEAEFEKRKEKKLYATSALYRLKKKYPLHFLLFPTPKK